MQEGVDQADVYIYMRPIVHDGKGSTMSTTARGPSGWVWSFQPSRVCPEIYRRTIFIGLFGRLYAASGYKRTTVTIVDSKAGVMSKKPDIFLYIANFYDLNSIK